jgi:voltage-gated potassium channel
VAFGDSLWWAFVTLATVGYGDFYPVTFPGRLVAAGLMAAGIAVVGVVTATAASWLIERVSAGRDDDEPATRGQVRALSLQLAELATPPSNTGENGNGS